MSGSKGSAEPLLSVKGLVAGYGSVEVLHEVSLEVREGEIVTLIGGNGAGKSTTLMCISGIVPVRGGEIRFAGEKISDGSGGVRADKLVGRGLVQVPEGRRIFPRMTVLENLMMGAYGRDDKDGIARDLEHVYALFDILKQRSAQLGGTLSGGEQQMLAIGRAILSKPRLLMMDEPSMGIAPLLVARIFEAVRELNREGLTILLVEQNARAALKLATRGYVLETGRMTLTDDAAKLLVDPRVREAYLGD
ncbi:MAG: ABC transporter ATP-binding protein [Planctomycetota bacterium]|jgi:branched-chain amino acid transport system ATP-binding protein|nr:ABC transporter ATP-binding protein [Planctomycetota bacterium]